MWHKVCVCKLGRNCKGETTQQNFLCYREGVKDYRDITIEMQKHEEKMIQDVIVRQSFVLILIM